MKTKIIVLIFVFPALVSCQDDMNTALSDDYMRKKIIMLKNVSLYKDKKVKYIEGMSDEYRLSLSYKDWYIILKNKIVYTLPDLDVKKTTRDNSGLKKIPGSMLRENTAFVLGKVEIDPDTYGIIVLEPGYYSITRIFIYPITLNGEVLRGLEIADWFADENEEVMIKSEFQNKKSFKVVTKITSKKYKDTKDLSAPSVVDSIKEKQIIWKFDKTEGFKKTVFGVRVKTMYTTEFY